MVFLWFGGAEYNVFNIEQSFEILFMVIIGGLGSLIGSFFGAALIFHAADRHGRAAACDLLNRSGYGSAPRPIEHLRFMILGAMIIFFLIVEPHGLARVMADRQTEAPGLAVPLLGAAGITRETLQQTETGRATAMTLGGERSCHSEYTVSALWPLPSSRHPLAVTAAQAQDGIYVPLLTYRTGAFAGSGIPIADGMHDYFTMLNERDGGIGGVPIIVEECETGYDTTRGVECYESVRGVTTRSS